jgi:hypothetical protein
MDAFATTVCSRCPSQPQLRYVDNFKGGPIRIPATISSERPCMVIIGPITGAECYVCEKGKSMKAIGRESST